MDALQLQKLVDLIPHAAAHPPALHALLVLFTRFFLVSDKNFQHLLHQCFYQPLISFLLQLRKTTEIVLDLLYFLVQTKDVSSLDVEHALLQVYFPPNHLIDSYNSLRRSIYSATFASSTPFYAHIPSQLTENAKSIFW